MTTTPPSKSNSPFKPVIEFLAKVCQWFKNNWQWSVIIIIFIVLFSVAWNEYSKLKKTIESPLIGVERPSQLVNPPKNIPSRTLCKSDPASEAPLTKDKFPILAAAITLSTYISTVSRGVIVSINDDLSSTKKRDKIRIDSINQKQVRYFFLLVSDIIVWVSLIKPISWNIFHWFLCLPPTNSYFNSMQEQVFRGLYIYIWYMLGLHIIQAIDHISTICRANNNINEWKKGAKRNNGQGPYKKTISTSRWFRKDLGIAEKLMTSEQFQVYLSLAGGPTYRVEDTKKMFIWKVVKPLSEIKKEVALKDIVIQNCINQLIAKQFIALISSDNYRFPNLDGLYKL